MFINIVKNNIYLLENIMIMLKIYYFFKISFFLWNLKRFQIRELITEVFVAIMMFMFLIRVNYKWFSAKMKRLINIVVIVETV